MAQALEDVRVAITENRFPEQLARLLERQGATVYACPLLREVPVEDVDGARQFMKLCEASSVDYIIFYTGIGVEFLFRGIPTPDVIARSKILARGPKAVNALKKHGVRADLVADSPTTEGIIQTLSRENLKGKSVLVQLYGNENPELRSALETMGATVTGISLYRYDRASDPEAVAELVRRITEDEIDVISFTNGPQAHFLVQSAEAAGKREALLQHLREKVIVVSIGEITSRALRTVGIEPAIVPQEPKMGPMVRAIADFFEERNMGCSTPSS